MQVPRVLGVSLAIVALIVLVSPQYAVGQNVQAFQLQPGGTATVSFEAFCTDFGRKFPSNVEPPNSLAQDQVRAALAYALGQGLTSSQAEQVQNAIWRIQGATDSPRGSQIAETIVTNASAAPAAPQGATSLLDAVQANQVRLEVTNWQPVGDQIQIAQAQDYFYGRGTLTVQNTSQQALSLYIPIGIQFPPAEQGSQTMAGYATNIQSQAQATTAATSAPTAAATAAATSAPTTAATTAATSAPTTAARATVVPTPLQAATLPEASVFPGNPQLLLLAVALFLIAAMVAIGRRV